MFVGRKSEFLTLDRLYQLKTSSFILIKGRRRIGKSTLVKEYCKQKNIPLYEFQGLSPGKKVTDNHQFENFQNTLAEYLDLKKIEFIDWQRAFEGLKKLNFNKKAVVLLDEISWMAGNQHTFASQLKSAWDRVLKDLPNLMFIVSGSVTSWIEDHISKNTGYVGRVNAEIDLKELSIFECQKLLLSKNRHLQSHNFWKLVSLTGGVPKYLEEIEAKELPENNIKLFFLTPGSFFNIEFDKIFSDIFLKKGSLYKKVLTAINKEQLSPSELSKKLGLPLNGDFSKILLELELAGFISRDYTWSLGYGPSKLSRLRLRDNYSRFYLKYVEKHQERIKKLPIKKSDSLGFINWDVIFGLQFENIVMNNLSLIVEILGINSGEVEHIGPFFQPATRGRRGVQIDLLIQTKRRALYIVEIKTQENLNTSVIDELEYKISHLQKPRGFSILPCLITIHRPTSSLFEKEYFYKIINLSDNLD